MEKHLVERLTIQNSVSITNIESSACGTPVAAGNVPGLRDSVKEGENGALFKYNNMKELVEKTGYILDNLVTLQQKSRAWAENFSWDKSAQETQAFLDGILTNG